jgi:acyl-coenzyme A thioesterase PaaI-like protein
MSAPVLSARAPRVLRVRRVQPRGSAPGDEVVVRMEPGLLRLLGLRDSGGRRLGEGMAPEWWLGLGAAATAATTAGEEARGWTGVSFSVEWTRPAREDETLRARSVIDRALPRRFGKTALVHRYEVASEATGEVLARGTLVLASGQPDTAEPTAPSDGAAAPMPLPAMPLPSATKARLRAVLTAVLPPVVAGPLRRAWRRLRYGPAAGAAAPLRWTELPAVVALGATAALEVEIENPGVLPEALDVAFEPPYGFGLECEPRGPQRLHVPAGAAVRVGAAVRALRPDEVNLGRPWTLTCILSGQGTEVARLPGHIAVPDPAPGRVFYVLTEDCETFDGGESTGDYGARSVLGNANGFMDPEEYRVQMIEKPQALNRIAERHGARWTHFWTTTQLSAARWAATQSRTGAWDRVVAGLEESVREGAQRHEYAPHIHFDFEPDSALPPQPRLAYDAATDGLLPREYYDPDTNPDHRFHGWDGARKGIAYVKEEGDFSRPDTKAGSLRAAARLLARLAPDRPQALVTRTGACDFGAAPPDLQASFRALEANGLLGNADAGLYEHVGAHPRGRQAYFCRRDDLEREIADLREAGPVQLRAPEIQFDRACLEDLSAWFERRLEQSRGPGVRVVLGMTHAMFMEGAPDPFRDASGGGFDTLDRHLAYVRRNHPGVAFATASEAVLEFLDYYSPTLRAVVTRPRFRSLDGRTALYPIRLLGRGIPLSAERPVPVTVSAPAAFDVEEVERLTVLAGGRPLASVAPSGNGLPRIEFLASGRDGYELEVKMAGAAAAEGEELIDEPLLEVLRVHGPELLRAAVAREGHTTVGDTWEWDLPPEPFRLLAHPVAGAADPLGRRVHPYGFYPLGVAVHAALSVCAGATPLQADLRWRHPVTGRTTFRLVTRVESKEPARVVLESRFGEGAVECAQMRITLAVRG